MKTTVEQLIDVLEIFDNLQMKKDEKESWIMRAKMELQDAYNAGFEFAKKKQKHDELANSID
jgi:hypothetical protein